MSKKMSSDSIEGGVRLAFRDLGIDKTIAAIQEHNGQCKSKWLLRKYSDPGDPKHHITLRDSIAIDAAFVAEGLPPPFQRISSHLLEVWSNGNAASASQLSIAHLTLSIEAAAGRVTETVMVAETVRDINGSNKGRSRPQDLVEILKRLEQLDEASRVLRSAVANAARARGDETGKS